MRKGKKGFVISFDAVIALLLLTSLIVAATSYLSTVEFKAGNSLSLKEITMDSLTVLEKSGKLEKAISTDKSSEVRAFLNKLPYNVCADLRVYSGNDLSNHEFLVLRPGCKQNFKESATIERSVVVESGGNVSIYLAELRAWYRVNEQ